MPELELGPAGDHVKLLPNDGLAWSDLEAPAEVHEALRALAGDVALAGHGIPALLVGPPGSGKKLAARILTAALRLDLVEVRLGGFVDDVDRLVPLILEQARAKHVSLLFGDAGLLHGRALGAALEAASAMKGLVLFSAEGGAAVDEQLRRAARLISFGTAGVG